MEREIIFRGKRIDNGEWVKGDLLTRRNAVSGESAIIFFDDEHIIPRSPAVDFETVGQYTGIDDSKGKMIFEDDVVCLFGVGKVIMEYPYIDLFYACAESSIGEIIGNIHDNPALL